MANELKGRRVAILATDGVEQVELTRPRDALKSAGADVKVVSPAANRLQGYNHREKGDVIPVDVPLMQAQPQSFDALVLPGGVQNSDKLRLLPEAIAFVRYFVQTEKPIAAICHGPWLLIDAGGARGRKMTSWPSLEADLRNAGAEWSDAPVVVDHRLVTSRKPADLPQFCTKMIAAFGQGGAWRHAAA